MFSVIVVEIEDSRCCKGPLEADAQWHPRRVEAQSRNNGNPIAQMYQKGQQTCFKIVPHIYQACTTNVPKVYNQIAYIFMYIYIQYSEI